MERWYTLLQRKKQKVYIMYVVSCCDNRNHINGYRFCCFFQGESICLLYTGGYSVNTGFVPSHRLIQKDHLVLIAVISTLVIISSSINNYGYFGFTKVVYGQSAPNQVNSNTNNSVNIQDIPAKKIHVGDIDVAYKVFGIGDPILLIPGGSDGMNAWDPSLLKTLTSNYTVIVFDPRGIGNTTIGSKPYTPSTLANDITGLMDVLKIPKAGVMGYSLGSYIAQQVTMMHPDKVNSLVLIGSSCGGKDHTPKPPEFIKLQSDIVTKV